MYTASVRILIWIGMSIYLTSWCGNLHASSISVPCKKVIISGDIEWPPYLINQSTMDQEDYDTYKPEVVNFTGVGVEIAEKIFADLDVKLEKALYYDRSSMLAALRSGRLDLVVSTYNYPILSSVANVLFPALVSDPITVAVLQNKFNNLNHWEDLIGKPGIIEEMFALDDETEKYFTKYLSVSRKGTLNEALQAVYKGEYVYVVGSSLQLNYAIKVNLMATSLKIKDDLTRRSAGVHMAFSKNSPCLHYAPYLRKRLQEYKNDGTVQKLIEKYIN